MQHDLLGQIKVVSFPLHRASPNSALSSLDKKRHLLQEERAKLGGTGESQVFLFRAELLPGPSRSNCDKTTRLRQQMNSHPGIRIPTGANPSAVRNVASHLLCEFVDWKKYRQILMPASGPV